MQCEDGFGLGGFARGHSCVRTALGTALMMHVPFSMVLSAPQLQQHFYAAPAVPVTTPAAPAVPVPAPAASAVPVSTPAAVPVPVHGFHGAGVWSAMEDALVHKAYLKTVSVQLLKRNLSCMVEWSCSFGAGVL